MKTALYKNCSLVRIPIKAGQTEYSLPQNVVWANKKIDRLIILAPQTNCTDPVDGITKVMTAANLVDCYITLYDWKNHELMHDVSWEQIAHTNNHALRIDAQLNLSLCRITFTSAPDEDCTLLLYAFYETRTDEYCDIPKHSITVDFPLVANEEISFRRIIDYTIHGIPETVKGMIVWDAVQQPTWITLRDHDLTYQMDNIHSEMARPDMNGGTAQDSQAALFLLDDLDIDFDYSRVRNATGNAQTQHITFLY